MKVQIGNYQIGENESVFVIAEIGNNHNGKLEHAKEMVDLAKKMNVPCVKFQLRDMKTLYREKTLNKESDDLSTEYVIDLLEKYQLTFEEHKELAEYVKSQGLIYMCTPWDLASVDKLESLGVPAYKVASADLTNLPLIKRLIETKKPLILSTGMSTDEEIKTVINYLNEHKADFILLHCNSTYPAPFNNIQLNSIDRLRALHPLIGYSGHERGTSVTLGAVALGAVLVERHFTLDRNWEGPDHAASLEFEDFNYLMEEIVNVKSALGGLKSKKISQGEWMNRETLGKSLVAAKDLKKGHVLTEQDIIVRSPGQGLSPLNYEKLLGLALGRDMEKEDYFFKSDISSEQEYGMNYSFNRPWGIPVRYHDFELFNSKIKPDLYEFHLSYSDMQLNLGDFFNGEYDHDFVVHAPELFENSHLLDMATEDEEYRKLSVRYMQETIDVTRALKKYFPKTKRPCIVTNIGGFSRDANISEIEKEKAYEIFAQSLKELDCEGVEIIPQTMAPFPWHFGGQRYQNLFVHAEETARVCRKLDLRICLDVSHSKLTCNHFEFPFLKFVEIVGPYTAHLHIGDATGVDGEGLQVGEGEIDFELLSNTLLAYAPAASFIPEIWQGHKNGGEGFWIALEKLNSRM
jgi:N-acetylneuraminate synthase